VKNIGDLLVDAPIVLKELSDEFVRRGDQCMGAGPTSQATACFLLALRSVSLLCSMGLLIKPNTRDAFDVLARSFMESRDLLIIFRFDDQGTRNQVHAWFSGRGDGAWKPKHKICEKFLDGISNSESELAKRWGLFSGLSHPTVGATKNSAALVVSWVTGRTKFEDIGTALTPKIADYLISIATFIVVATFEIPQWVPLGCDLRRMPHAEPFRLQTAQLVTPISDQYEKHSRKS
jgi:hypothetical protein